jgi:DNA polymerase-3 subunit chi
MSKVDFYILPTDSLSARLDLPASCAKAWRLGHRVYLHCRRGNATSWTCACGASRARPSCPTTTPNCTGRPRGAGPAAMRRAPDLLINLGGEVPGFVKQFERVAEIVVEEPAIRQAARKFPFLPRTGLCSARPPLTATLTTMDKP